jgi:hypothetical protein
MLEVAGRTIAEIRALGQHRTERDRTGPFRDQYLCFEPSLIGRMPNAKSR